MSITFRDVSKEQIYKKFLPISEKRILHKLIQAIIREKLVDYEWIPKEKESGTFILKTANNIEIIINVIHTYQLGQLDIKQTFILEDAQTHIEINHPAELLNVLFEDIQFLNNNLENLREELKNSILNDAVALTADKLRSISGKNTEDKGAFENLLSLKNNNFDFSPLAYLEQWVIEGHTIHPCSKTRLGLSIEENEKYAPEWGSEVHLIPLAVHTSHSNSTSINDKSITELLLSDYPNLNREMKTLHSYNLIPVHPWQYEHTIKKFYKEELDKGIIIPLKSKISVKPLMSFRSMAPSKGRKRHHIKTAVNIQMTSARRTVSPASVKNGPIISKLLKEIQKKDSLLNDKVVFLSEVAGNHYCSNRQSTDIDLEKNLSCIIRENPEEHLAYGELAIPAASLINKLPISNGILIKDLIKSYSEVNKMSLKEAVVNYMDLYSKVVLPSLVNLIIKYGISLEAHLQNAIVIFENGTPVKLMIRDNGGIRIHKGILGEWTEILKINNATNLLTDSSIDLYQMFSHAVLHNHLGEIIVKLTKEFGINESLLWDKVGEVIQETLNSLRKQERYKQVADFEDHIFGKNSYLKALLTMRLSDSIVDNMYVMANNPLQVRVKGEIK